MTIVSQTVTAGDPYSRTITAPGALFFATVDLPNGLTLGQTGVISGIPIQPGRFTITILVRGSGGTSAAVLNLTVLTPPTPFITSVDTKTHEMGVAFSYQITASSPTTILSYDATNLPTGLTVNTSSGLISGTPTSASNNSIITVTVILSATNAAGTGYQDLILTLQQRPVITSSLTPLSFPRSVAISPYTITASKSPLSFGASPLPSGLTVDSGSGVISGVPTLSLATPSLPEISTIAGSPDIPGNYSIGNVDGTGLQARFNRIRGIVIAPSGDYYALDSSNTQVRKITSAGVVTSIPMGGILSVNCRGITIDSTGNLYVGNLTQIIKRTPAGVLSVFASGFTSIYGLACDSSDNIYATDQTNYTVKKITPGGTVTVFAGGSSSPSFADGTGTAARFRDLYGIAISSSGNVYVYDAGNAAIRKITSAGVVTTIAKSRTAAFSPFGVSDILQQNTAGNSITVEIAVDSQENVYFSVQSSGAAGYFYIAKVSNAPAGTYGNFTSIIVGARVNIPLTYDGLLPNGYLTTITGMGFDSSGHIIVAQNYAVRRVILSNPASDVTTLAGTAGSSGLVDGTGSAARFSSPSGMCLSPSGDLYVCDSGNNVIRKITSAGVVTTFATGFNNPQRIVYHPTGDFYVTDTGNYVVKKITSAGVVTVLAGFSGTSGYVDGTGTAARFNNPIGITIGPSGDLFVADYSNSYIRKVTLSGVVSTYFQSTGNIKDLIYDGTSTPYNSVSYPNFWYFGPEPANYRPLVKSFLPGTETGTLIANPSASFNVGLGTTSSILTASVGGSYAFPVSFGSLESICIDSFGSIYMTDSVMNNVRIIFPFTTPTVSGTVASVLAGLDGKSGSANGDGLTATFNAPKGIAAGVVDNLPVVYVADTGNHTIRKIIRQAIPDTTLTILSANNNVLVGTASLSITVTG